MYPPLTSLVEHPTTSSLPSCSFAVVANSATAAFIDSYIFSFIGLPPLH